MQSPDDSKQYLQQLQQIITVYNGYRKQQETENENKQRRGSRAHCRRGFRMSCVMRSIVKVVVLVVMLRRQMRTKWDYEGGGGEASDSCVRSSSRQSLEDRQNEATLTYRR